MNTKCVNNLAFAISHQVGRDCQRLRAIQAEKQALYDSYRRYRGLLRDEDDTRARIIASLGVLGKYGPTISEGTAYLISTRPLKTDEIRSDIKIWEMFELCLSIKDGGLAPSDFQDFLASMEIETTPQAIDSAIRAHPEVFQVHSEGGRRTVSLRTGR